MPEVIAEEMDEFVLDSTEDLTQEPAEPETNVEPKSKRPLIAQILDHNGNFKKQSEMVQKIFPGPAGKYFRMLTYAYLYGVWAYDKPWIDPQYFPINFIGDPGVGKSARVKAWCRVLGIELIKCTLQGVADFESVLGIKHIDPAAKETILYPPKNFPKSHEHDRYCVIFLDDFNRGEPHCIAGGMEFANTGAYNDYKLPRLGGIVAAMNPQGTGNKVKSLDRAQISRFLSTVLAHRPEDFLDQLVVQNVPTQLLAYHTKFKHELVKTDPYILPDDREINDRNRMGHALFCQWAQYDLPVMHEASMAVYGPQFMAKLETVESGDFPIETSEILDGDIDAVMARVAQLVSRRKQDLLMLSMTMLCRHLNDPKTVLSKDQLAHVCQYFLQPQPDGVALMGLRKLVQKSAPRAAHYRQVLMLWKSKDGKSMGPLGEHFVKMTNQTKLEARESRQAYLEGKDLQAA